MPKRLAITIAGAVSLGSYEAGVLYEVLTTLADHNRLSPPDERIEIDVLTGASAGGMTAAIAAQKLLYEGDSLRSPADNPFHVPWVERVDIARLLAMRAGESATHSVLSSDEVEDISRDLLTARYGADAPQPRARRAHPAAASTIHLGLALSNLNGVDYALPLRPTGSFRYTRHEDRFLASFAADGADGRDAVGAWEEVRRAAVACGAFPFAFRAQTLHREAADYPDPDVLPLPAEGSDFAFTDGGVFQNEPLGMAKDLVDGIDHHLATESRFYLFVSPGSRTSTASGDFSAETADFVHFGGQLIAAVIDQAQFQDWIRAERVNNRLDVFNRRALSLHEDLRSGRVQPAELAGAAVHLVAPLYRDRESRQVEEPEGARQRLRSQFAAETELLERERGTAAASAWIDAVLAIETAAGLGPRDEMRIYGITTERSKLAGADLLAFQGFFDERYRQHDYDVGRLAARKFVLDINAANDPLGPIRGGSDSEIKIDTNLDGLRLDKVDSSVRRDLLARLEARVEETLSELGLHGPVRWALRQFVIRGQLERLLRL